MKLSKFVKRAKSESYCVVIHADDSGIWLGTRLALYNATELPYMEGKEQAGAVLDIDSKAWEKMFFDEKYTAHAGADFGMNLTETDPMEQEARRVPLEMFYKGMGLVGLVYGNGGELIFYDAALIAPIFVIVIHHYTSCAMRAHVIFLQASFAFVVSTFKPLARTAVSGYRCLSSVHGFIPSIISSSSALFITRAPISNPFMKQNSIPLCAACTDR